LQEFEDLWPKLDRVFDDGMLGDTFHSRQGSTVVDLSKKGTYKVINAHRHSIHLFLSLFIDK
jgi:hypothetical protein